MSQSVPPQTTSNAGSHSGTAVASSGPLQPTITEGLHIVLFGLPGSGKTSLLGCIGELIPKSNETIHGSLFDLSGKLDALTLRLQSSEPAQTHEEIVAYPLRFEPASGKPVDLVLLDCSGEAAKQLIAQKSPLEDIKEGTLAEEVAEADTLILIVDASANDRELNTTFQQFGGFLSALKSLRGERTDVGGLPVFLVLNRADLLALPSDVKTTWEKRIAEKKLQVGKQFRDFLLSNASELVEQSDSPEEPKRPDRPSMNMTPLEEGLTGGFGRLALKVCATARRYPSLIASEEKLKGSFGVDSLINQCIKSATEYQAQYRKSQRRLFQMLSSVVLLVLCMSTLVIAMLMFHKENPTRQLEIQIDDIRFSEGETVAARLTMSDEELLNRQMQLKEVRNSEHFQALSEDNRQFIEDRLSELLQYQNYLKKLLNQKPSLYALTTEAGLDRFVADLKGDLALPDSAWIDTPAGRLHQRRLESAAALQRGVQRIRNWYLESSDRANRLWSFTSYHGSGGIEWGAWTADVEKMIDPARKAPYQELEVIPEAPDGTLTYGLAARFDRVLDVRTSWELDRERLHRLLNLTTALGLARPAKERPAVLVIPTQATMTDVRKKLELLKTVYPTYEKTFVRGSVPEVISSQVEIAARRQYELLLNPGREEVLRQLQLAGKGSEESVARWDKVREWLRNPVELMPWNQLAQVLLKLSNPSSEQPANALALFLSRSQLVIDELRSIQIEIPQVRGLKPNPTGKLTIHHSGTPRQPALGFDLSGDPIVDRQRGITIYTYRLADGRRLLFKPGDTFTAELPLTGGKQRLVWSNSRSKLYQIESLRLPPRLQQTTATSPTDGRIMEDIHLIFRPADSFPKVPDLLPNVKLEQ